MIQLWRSNPELRAESDAVYALYRGGDIIDVGAFHGWYAVLLSPRAKPGDTFLMVEPDPSAFPHLLSLLGELASLFPHLRYIALPTAAGNGSAVRPVYPYGMNGHPRFEPSSSPDDPPALRLDELTTTLHLSPAFIKVDVEGAEIYVVNGMTDILDRHAPSIMLEVHPHWQPEGVSPDDVTLPIRERGFTNEVLAVTPDATRMLWQGIPCT